MAFSIIGNGQNENTQWRFGQNAGLDFLNIPPSPVPGSALSSQESAASIADASGMLLFYTDGITVWDQNDNVMANGTSLSGNSSSTQGALILKKPGNGTEYYIFTTGQNGPMCYSIVDIAMATGMGSVTVKNVTLTSNSSEKLTATKHCNGVDYWIVGHEKTTNKFLSYQLTASGVNPVAVVSQVGSSYAVTSSGQGQLKFSPAGNKLAAALFDLNTIELFDFNKSTGSISYLFSLTNFLSYNYGVEFSPDGTKLYSALSAGSSSIYQWDLCAGSPFAINASQFLVTNTGPVKSGMMLGPDGQIYVAKASQNILAVITNPDLPGSACGYIELGQNIIPGVSTSGFPNNIKNYTPSLTPATFSYTTNNLSTCYNATFTPQLSTVVSACGFVPGYSLSNVQWNFGDPASGPANTSVLLNPTHAYSATGTYTAQLIVNYTCGGGSDTILQQVVINQGCFSVLASSVTCAGAGSATVSPLGGTGPYTYTWLPGGQTGSVATNLLPGTYTVVAYDPFANTLLNYTTTLLPSIPFIGSVVTGSIKCNGAATGSASAVNISGGSGNYTYIWTNGPVTYTVPDPVSLTAGNWNLIITDAFSNCTINNTFVIVQPPALMVSVVAPSPSVCVGSPFLLSALLSGGVPAYSYTWSGGPADTDYFPVPTTVGTFVYPVNATDANNCTAFTTISVTSVANPVMAVNSATVCPLQPATLTALGAATYSWNGMSGGNAFIANPAVSTQYTLSGTTAGCTSTLAALVVVKTVPVFTISSNSPVCTGASFTAEVNSGISFSWQGPQGFSASSPSVNITGVSSGLSGQYQVTVTAANNCTSIAETSLTVLSLPTIIVAGCTVCTGETINLMSASTATNILWSGPLDFLSNLQNPVISNAAANMGGNYTLTATSNDNCVATAAALVNVVLPPDLSVSLSSSSMCAQAFSGSPNTITLTSAGANTYTLSTPSHILNPNPSGPSSPVTMGPPYVPGGASTATLFGSNGVCTASITAIFTIVPNPTLSVINPTPVICAGQGYTYTSAGADSYTWTAATPGNTVYTTGSVVASSPAFNSVFSVVGGSLGCYSTIQSSSLTVNPLPTLLLNPEAPIVCQNKDIQLVSYGSGTLHTWSPPLWLNTTSGASVVCSPQSGQTYTVVSSLNTCTTVAMITVTVQPSPTALITATQTTMCVNGDLTLLGDGGLIHFWKGPSGFESNTHDLILKGYSTAYTGIYTLTVKDQYGCKAKATQAITVHPLPVGNINNVQGGCVPLDLQPGFKINSSSSPTASASWYYAGQTYPASCPLIHITKSGTYPLFASITDLNGCTRTFSTQITGHPQPEAQFTFSPDKPTEELDEVYFNDASGQAVSYHWNFGNNLYTSTSKNPTMLFEDAGIYPVELIVKNQWQCSDTIIKTVEIITDDAIYIPNSFTPNDDGHNDHFGPVCRRTLKFRLIIMDRWGAVVFEGVGNNASWDGRYQGQPCKEDVYVWILEANDKSLMKFDKKMTGRVTLYR